MKRQEDRLKPTSKQRRIDPKEGKNRLRGRVIGTGEEGSRGGRMDTSRLIRRYLSAGVQTAGSDE